jgi:hypothetical protein
MLVGLMQVCLLQEVLQQLMLHRMLRVVCYLTQSCHAIDRHAVASARGKADT